MKKIKIFYLKNYRAIHHLVFIAAVFSLLKILSIILWPFNLIFDFSPTSLLLDLVILVSCYFLNEQALIRAGLTKEYMAQLLEQAQKEGL